jgi:hypothetical protein
MRIVTAVLALIGVVGLLFGVFILFVLKGSALQEGEGLTAILIGVAGIGSATIATAVMRLTDHVERGFAEAALARRDRARGDAR